MTALDASVFLFINTHWTSARWDPFWHTLSSTNLWLGVIGLGLVVLTILRPRNGLRVGLSVVFSAGLADFTASQVLKPSIGRLRPCHTYQAARRVGGTCGALYSMPSNHAANGAPITTAIALSLSGPTWILCAVLTLLVGFSRVYLGVHYPGDILAGFLWGTLCALAIAALTRKILKFRGFLTEK